MTITLRDVTPDDDQALAHVVVPANEQAFRGLLPDSTFDFTEAQSAANWRHLLVEEGFPDEDFMLLAESDGEVVGYIWGGPSDKEAAYRGEICVLAVHPAYQRRGIGRQLVCELARRFADRGIYSLRVWTLRINPNRVFYERLGGIFVAEFLYETDGFTETGTIYGWADTRALLDARAP